MFNENGDIKWGKILTCGIVIILVLSLAGWAINWMLLPTKILNPDEGLARWRWFYDTYQALNATKGNIETAQNSLQSFININGNISTWDWEQRSEYQRLTTVRDGYITHYNNIANQYNAKMEDITRSWSAPKDLPTYIANYQAP